MFTLRSRRFLAAVALSAALPLVLTGCGMDDKGDSASEAASSSPDASKGEESASGDDTVAGPFGPACASVPKEGAGSFDGMAKDPVATAASNNPALSRW
jgi:hypothetical protein